MLSQRFDLYLTARLGVRTTIVGDPLKSVAIGNGLVLESSTLLREAAIQL